MDAVELSVRIDQGFAQWFMILVENESSEEVTVTEVLLERAQGHRLTNAARPGPKENWTMQPAGRVNIAWQAQPDPAVNLATLHRWPDKDFETDVRVKMLCEILGRRKWCVCALRVQVDPRNRHIRQLV